MTNAYEVLGIVPRLVIGREDLAVAYRRVGMSTHPDAGGSDAAFAELREAHELLLSPSRRLRHWLELHGHAVDLRGSVAPAMMEWFAKVADVTQCAETIIRKRDSARSALGLALLEKETQLCREAVEAMIAEVEAGMETRCAVFPELETFGDLDLARALELVRDLAFLEKWRAGLRGLFARLV